MKSPSTQIQSSNNSSSRSSTLSQSSNSPIFLCTRKPRSQRQRPNQKCNEAAALLSTACPNIFSSKNLKSPPKYYKTHENNFPEEYSELLLLYRDIDKSELFLPQYPVQENERPSFQRESNLSPLCENPCQVNRFGLLAIRFLISKIKRVLFIYFSSFRNFNIYIYIKNTFRSSYDSKELWPFHSEICFSSR